MFKVNNKDTRTTQLASNYEHMLTLNIFHTFSSASIVNFEHVIAGREIINFIRKPKRRVSEY